MIDGMTTSVVPALGGCNYHIVMGKNGGEYRPITHKTAKLAKKFAADLNNAPGSCGKWVVMGPTGKFVVGVKTAGEGAIPPKLEFTEETIKKVAPKKDNTTCVNPHSSHDRWIDVGGEMWSWERYMST